MVPLKHMSATNDEIYLYICIYNVYMICVRIIVEQKKKKKKDWRGLRYVREGEREGSDEVIIRLFFYVVG
jgi:hypothetical protein